MPYRGQGIPSLTIFPITSSPRRPVSFPALLLALRLAVPADSTLEAQYASGAPFDQFLADARARRAAWVHNWEASLVPDDVLARARSLPGRWRLLVIAVDSCSDSVNTIPYLARLAFLDPLIEMRIISPDAARALMAARPTPDGRPATPTVIILDESGQEVGSWIERPSALQTLAMAARAEGTLDRFLSGKQAWYDADAGASTVREVVELIAHAASAGARPLPSSPGRR